MYIRTDDGIEKIDDDWKEFYKDHVNNRQADTIEELCDYVAVWCIENDTPLFIHKSMLRDDRPSLQEQKANKEIYDFKFCVLTSVGLIFADNMNENGELELI